MTYGKLVQSRKGHKERRNEEELMIDPSAPLVLFMW
jgi:hypothetical protein